MKYRLYRLKFPNGIHVGQGNLDESLMVLHADTLFSALFLEALKSSEETAGWLLEETRAGRLLLTDAFPYIGKTAYLPKPMIRPRDTGQVGDSVAKKAFKKMSYIPMERIGSYLDGKLDAIAENEQFKKIGGKSVKTSAAINGQEETLPYHVGLYRFSENSGLYFIVGTENENDLVRMYDLIDSLSFEGLGGKRSSGLGRFEIRSEEDMDPSLFEGSGSRFMSLSVSLPKEEEMDLALSDACFNMKKRSGFVFSDNYAPEQRKKRDTFFLTSGSCFKTRFEGDVYDVSSGGNHPVYRYAKPVFWILQEEE